MATTAEQITRIRAVVGKVEGVEQVASALAQMAGGADKVADGFDRIDLAARRVSQNITRGDTGFDRLMRSYGDATSSAATRVERDFERIARAFTSGRFEPVGGADTAIKALDTMVAKFAGVGPAVQEASARLKASLREGAVGTVDAFNEIKTALASDQTLLTTRGSLAVNRAGAAPSVIDEATGTGGELRAQYEHAQRESDLASVFGPSSDFERRQQAEDTKRNAELRGSLSVNRSGALSSVIGQATGTDSELGAQYARQQREAELAATFGAESDFERRLQADEAKRSAELRGSLAVNRSGSLSSVIGESTGTDSELRAQYQRQQREAELATAFGPESEFERRQQAEDVRRNAEQRGSLTFNQSGSLASVIGQRTGVDTELQARYAQSQRQSDLSSVFGAGSDFEQRQQADELKQVVARQKSIEGFRDLEGSISPASRAAERFVAQWKTVNDALAAEPALAERAAAALAGIAEEQFTGGGRNKSPQRAQTVAQAAQAALGTEGGEEQVRAAAMNAAKGVQELETSHKAGAMAARLYAIQLVQTASSLEAGMPLMTTLVQQGHQVLDIFLATGGKLSDIGGIARGLAGALFSVPGAFTAIAVGVGVAAYAITNMQQRMVDLRDGLRLYTSDFVSSAERIRTNTSSLLPQLPAQSKAELDQIQQGFVRLRPDLNDTQLQSLTKDASALAKVLGGDLKEAGRQMGLGLTEPAKLADELAKQHLPGMTEALRNNITELQRSGQYGQATAKVMDLLRSATKGTQDDVTTATATWQGLVKAWRGFVDDIEPTVSKVGQAILGDLKLFITDVKNAINDAKAVYDWVKSHTADAAANNQALTDRINGINGRQTQQSAGPARIVGQVGSGYRTPDEDFAAALARRENPGGDPRTVNQLGYVGNYQYGTERLADVRFDGKPVYTPPPEGEMRNQWKGTINIPGFQDVHTPMEFRNSAAAQQAVFEQDYKQVQSLIDKLDPQHLFDVEGLHALAHLGGTGAMQKFIQSGGTDGASRADANGTRPIDYYREFSRGAGVVTSARNDPNNPNEVAGGTSASRSVTRRTDGSFSGDIDRASRSGDVSFTNTGAEDFRQAQEALGRYRQSGAASDIPLAREAIQQQIDAWERYRQQFAEGTKEARDAAQAQRQLRGELYDTITPMDRIHREEQLRLNTTQVLDPAERRLAEANQNLGETARRSGDADAAAADKARTRQNVMRELNLQIAQTLHDNGQQIAANDRMASSYERGTAAVQAAENRERAIAEVRKAGLDPLKEGAAQVDKLTESYGRLTAQQAQAAAGSNIFQSKQQLSTTQLETGLVGHPQTEVSQALAANRVLQSQQALALGPDDPTIQREVDYAKQVAAANDKLNLMKQSWSEVEQTGSRALDTLQQGLEKAFHTGKIKDFATAALQALQDIGMEGLKLSLLNPLKNWLFGSNSPTIGSVGQAAGGAGGAIGGLTKWLFGSSDKGGGGSGGLTGSGVNGVGSAAGNAVSSPGALSRFWNWITGGSSDNGNASSSTSDAITSPFYSGTSSPFNDPGFGSFHTGGLVSAGVRGGLPASVWDGASRFHTGTDLSDDPNAATGADEYGTLGWFGSNQQNVGGVSTQDNVSSENQDRGPGNALMTAVSSFVSAFASKAFGSALSSVGNQVASGFNWAGGQLSGAASGSTGYDWFGNVGKGYYGPAMPNAHQFHTGGLVGAQQSSLHIPASVFDGADRFHTGWAGANARRSPAAQLHLAHDEVPAILQKGEVVLTQAQQSRVGRSRIAAVLHQGGYATGTYGPSFPDSVWYGASRFHEGGDLADSLSLPNTLASPAPTMPMTARMGNARGNDRVVIHAPINVNGVKNVQEFANSQQQVRAMAARAISRATRSL